MRFAVTSAVLLAVVATALVAVCQHSETRRLQHRVWQLEQRRLHLERQAQRLESAIEAGRTPRRLLVESDLDMLRGAAPKLTSTSTSTSTSTPAPPARPRTRAPAPEPEIALPPGFVTGGNFEGDER